MRKTFLLGVVFAVGLLPRDSIAEINLPGAHDTFVFGNSSLNRHVVSETFNRIFGAKDGLIAFMPSLTRSGLGRPLAVISFEYGGGMEALSHLGSDSGSGSLEQAIIQFETEIRAVACGGAYNEFLGAGGSLRIELNAPEVVPTEDQPLVFGTSIAQLMRVEIDTLKDCEAN